MQIIYHGVCLIILRIFCSPFIKLISGHIKYVVSCTGLVLSVDLVSNLHLIFFKIKGRNTDISFKKKHQFYITCRNKRHHTQSTHTARHYTTTT
jgi:hypothetical protein